jgi:hypothetical protein
MKQKARFWFCPVYWDSETNTPTPRNVPGFVLEFALWLHHSMIFMASLFDVPIDQVYPITIIKGKDNEKRTKI